MDKLRALQYFNRAVEIGSFAGAARALNVSTPAVTNLIASLERSLGVTLLNRATRGVSLTADGEHYYERSRKIEAEFYDLELHFGEPGKKPRGVLNVGIRHFVGQNCVMPNIGRFLARFPDIRLVMKPVESLQDIESENLDVLVAVGWPPQRELAVRHLAQTRFIVCASAEYCLSVGRPQKPEDLREHHCLVTRNLEGVLLDRWAFQRASEQRTVDVNAHLLSSDRLWLEEAACSGLGIIRLIDLTGSKYLASGALVPLLEEWEPLESPTIYAAYPRAQRRSKAVRAFLDFLIEVFAEYERQRPLAQGNMARVVRPQWWDRAHGRHSVYAARAER